MDALLSWRKEFPTLETTVHMISHSLGAMPRRTYDRLQEYAETWATRGIRAWEEGWWEMPVKVGDLIGGIIGAGTRRSRDAAERVHLRGGGALLFRLVQTKKQDRIRSIQLPFESLSVPRARTHGRTSGDGALGRRDRHTARTNARRHRR